MANIANDETGRSVVRQALLAAPSPGPRGNLGLKPGRLVAGLGRIGDFGLFAPPLAFVLGLLLPPLAQLGQAVLIPCVILLAAISVGLAEPGRIALREWPPVLVLAGCNLIATPIVVHALCLFLGLQEASGWLVLVAACPAAGGAVLVASLLGLPVRPLLLTQLLSFFALPLTAPLIAGLVLEGQVISASDLFWRVMLMVGVPALLGYAARRALGERRRALLVRPIRGLGVFALAGIALSIAAGMPRLDLAAPMLGHILLGLLLASVVGSALGLLAARLVAPGVMPSFALAGAVRNVGLLWSATQGLAPPEGELVMMLGTLWTLLLPALMGVARWGRNRAEREIPPQASVTPQSHRRGMITPQFRSDYRTRGASPRAQQPARGPAQAGAVAPNDPCPASGQASPGRHAGDTPPPARRHLRLVSDRTAARAEAPSPPPERIPRPSGEPRGGLCA